MGQLERYGLYVLCVVIFLILGVALWGGDPAMAAKPDSLVNAVTRDLRSSLPASETNLGSGPEAKDARDKTVAKDDAVARLRRAFGTSSETDAPKPEHGTIEPLAGVTTVPKADAGKTATPPAAPATTTEYVVKKGDSLEAIAMQHFGKKSAWTEIVKVNPGLTPTKLMTGDKIKLPPKTVLAAAAPATSPPPVTAKADEYEIRDGDNLENIALAKLGKRTLWRDIVTANPGLDPARLKRGTRIKIPAVAKASPPR